MRDRRARLAGPAGIGTCRPPPSDLSSGDTTLGAGRRHQSHRPLALSGEVGAVDAEAPRLDQRREEVQHVGGGSCRGGGGAAQGDAGTQLLRGSTLPQASMQLVQQQPAAIGIHMAYRE